MKIRLGLWQVVDIDEMRNLLMLDPDVPEDMSNEDIIDYLYARMSEDIDKMVRLEDVDSYIMHEEI
jgi:hypothetical protein